MLSYKWNLYGFSMVWVRVRRVRRGSISLELPVCGGSVLNILLLSLVTSMHRDNRCMYMAHVCFYVCSSDCVGVCGNICCVAAVVKDSFFCFGVLKYVVYLCKDAYLPTWPPSHLSIYPYTHLPIYPFTYLPIYPSTHLPIYPSTHLLTYL